MENIDDIISRIDAGLEEAHQIYMPQRLYADIQDQVWSDLSESVAGGWRTQAEAEDTFMEWRATHLSIGRIAIQ